MPKKPTNIIEPIDANLDDVVDVMLKDNTPETAMNKFSKVAKDSLPHTQQKGELEFIKEGEQQLFEFKKKQIRSIFHDNEWMFSVVDVVEAMTESDDSSAYWRQLKKRLISQEGSNETVTNCHGFKLVAKDGKSRSTDCTNVENIFRIIQSIPSKKAEPFKRWLAKVGFERIQEEQNPELAIKRAMFNYKAKGYDDKWVNARLQTIVSRKELTSEWKKRGVSEGLEYAKLTNVISKRTFDRTTKEHKELKDLKKHHSLRDHMSPLELALTMLGEATTTELARNVNAQGYNENKEAAIEGGQVAGGARKNIEKKLGKPVVTNENYLPGSKQKKLDKI